MLFNILVGNHGTSFHSLQLLGPLVNYVRSALSLCGHEVTVARSTWNEDAVNLLFEHFPDPQFWIDEIRRARQEQGCTVGVIATELMVDNTIPYAKNGIYASDVAGNEREQAAYIQKRIAGLNAIAPDVDFMWSFLERTAREYASRCKLSRFLPVGHVGGPPAETRRSPKDIDVAFFGTLTPHRAAVIENMTRGGRLNVVAVGRGTPAGVLPDYVVASLLDRAKIGLNLTLSAVGESTPGLDPRFASCIRVVQMLERDLCVVSEEIPLDNPYQAFMSSAPPEGLAETCLQLLGTGEWRERGAGNAARFRERMDVRKACAPVIDETLSALNAAGR